MTSKPRILCAFGIDVDAVAGWLGSYGGEDSASDVSRGLFAGEVGILRLLRLFEKFQMKTTWFVPGHSLDTFPDEMAQVRDAGHEIGLHGYSHENPTSLSVEQQKVILDHTFDQITKFWGRPPMGSVAPWWEVSKEGGELLLDKGIIYDHSFMHRDSQAYYLRIGDDWKKIDYDKHPSTWMEPVQRGETTGMVEIPVNWDLDDLPPMIGWTTLLTYVSGRPHVLKMLERFIAWVNTHDGVEWVTYAEIADDFRRRNPAPKGARMPKGFTPPT
ncbi:hypothetical protein CcaverHIS002_0602410 [Cutaneotrichosporon cavernicola]|nr:hypothetical protein CcaverHIS002_0602410 [Cutaneotrichosporon cavernicola]